MKLTDKIFVTGHRGMVGSALLRILTEQGYSNIITSLIDLRNQRDVNSFFANEQPQYVFLPAGKVGGVKANNSLRGEFIYDNIMIEANVINAAKNNGVQKLLFTGSSCIYPKSSRQPIKEEYLLTGELEPTNEPYAVAKIAGIKLCQAYHHQYGCNFICAMPTNSYGPNDKYDLENSHVLPSLLRKIITAKNQNIPIVEIWGTGHPRREFLYVDDMAEALIFLMNNYDSPEIINVGTGQDISIKDLACLIAEQVGYTGQFEFNGQLDGMMLKRLDVTKINELGWKATTSLTDGLKKTVECLAEAQKHW